MNKIKLHKCHWLWCCCCRCSQQHVANDSQNSHPKRDPGRCIL